MFDRTRILLRQAEEAARSDRCEEALDLVARPEIADHYRAVRLRDQLAARLAERAREQLRQGNSQAAWQDLRQAEIAGAAPAKLNDVRGELLDHVVAEIKTFLDSGNPKQALVIADKLKGRTADGSEYRRLREAAIWWDRGLTAATNGMFSQAIENLETAQRHLVNNEAIVQKIRSLRADLDRSVSIRSQLQDALSAQDWPVVLKLADGLLELAPACREGNQLRDEALRRLGVHVPNGSPKPVAYARPVDREVADATGNPHGRFILWVDGIGGFLVCLNRVVTIGQATPGTVVDIPIFGDLSRMHATLVRDEEGYTLRSDREIYVNDKATKQSPLKNGDLIRFGRSVKARFSLSCPFSETARLDIESPHRLHLSMSGILLMAETCVLSPSSQANVRVPHAADQVVLCRQSGGIWCRTEGSLEIDGRPQTGRGPLQLTSRATVGDLSFSLEPLKSLLNQV